MKIAIVKGKEKINIDSHCLSVWEKAGWKKADEEKTVNKNAPK